MNEKEKMISGFLYSPEDEQLIEDRKNCKSLCHKYNSFSPANVEDRKK